MTWLYQYSIITALKESVAGLKWLKWKSSSWV